MATAGTKKKSRKPRMPKQPKRPGAEELEQLAEGFDEEFVYEKSKPLRGAKVQRYQLAKSKRGGRRQGAGRPRELEEPTRAKLYRLQDKHIALVEEWQREHGLRSASEALRNIIESIK